MGQVGVPGEDGDARVEVEAPDRVEGGDAAVAVTPLSRWTGKSKNRFETELPSTSRWRYETNVATLGWLQTANGTLAMIVSSREAA